MLWTCTCCLASSNSHSMHSCAAAGLVCFFFTGWYGRHAKQLVSYPALMAACNFTVGDEAQTQAAVDAGILSVFRSLLIPGSPMCSFLFSFHFFASFLCFETALLKEAIFGISNIAAGSPRQIRQLRESGLLELALQLFDGSRTDVQKQIIWTVHNVLAYSSSYMIQYVFCLFLLLLRHGVFESVFCLACSFMRGPCIAVGWWIMSVCIRCVAC